MIEITRSSSLRRTIVKTSCTGPDAPEASKAVTPYPAHLKLSANSALSLVLTTWTTTWPKANFCSMRTPRKFPKANPPAKARKQPGLVRCCITWAMANSQMLTSKKPSKGARTFHPRAMKIVRTVDRVTTMVSARNTKAGKLRTAGTMGLSGRVTRSSPHQVGFWNRTGENGPYRDDEENPYNDKSFRVQDQGSGVRGQESANRRLEMGA